MTKRQLSSLLDDPPLPGTGRLSVLAAGFFLAGLVSGLDGVALVAALVVPGLQWTPPPHPWIAVLTAVALSLACFRAGWLLDHRRKAGGVLTIIGVLAVVVSALGEGGQASGVLVCYGVVVLIAASVWRHLA